MILYRTIASCGPVEGHAVSCRSLGGADRWEYRYEIDPHEWELTSEVSGVWSHFPVGEAENVEAAINAAALAP